MRKQFILLSTILLFGCNLALGLTNTFTMADDDQWNNPNNWSLGTVPNSSQDVTISTGTTVIVPDNYIARCRKLWVKGKMGVMHSGMLHVSASGNTNPGINIHITGKFVVYGYVTCNYNGSNQFTGFFNNGLVDFYPDSKIVITGFYTGFKNNNGYIKNNGLIRVLEATVGFNNESTFKNEANGELEAYEDEPDVSLSNSGTFTNKGLITLGAKGAYTCLSNREDFTNHSSGEILCLSGENGILNDDDGTFQNYGQITFKAALSILARGESTFTNFQYGNVLINGEDDPYPNIGLELDSEDAIVTNHGNIFLHEIDAYPILADDGELYNSSTGLIDIDGDNTIDPVLIRHGKIINDGGTINLFSHLDALRLIYSDALFHNKSCGTVKVNLGDVLVHNGLLHNEGWMHFVAEDWIHEVTAGQFLNEGVIEDRFNELTGLNIDNQSVIVDSLEGPVFVNQPTPNALTLGSLNFVNYISWRYSINGFVAGWYNSSANTLTTNNIAIGADFLYLRIRILGCGYKWIKVGVDGGVLNAAPPRSQELHNTSSLDQKDLVVFPNPIDDRFTVQGVFGADAPVETSLMDVNGRIISTQQIMPDASGKFTLHRPTNTTSGIYLLRVKTANGTTEIQKLIFKEH